MLIVGAGRIGRETARLVEAFGAERRARRPRRRPRRAAAAGPTSSRCTCRSPTETRHLIDARRLRLMKPSAVLINTARGPVVDEAALAAALARRRRSPAPGSTSTSASRRCTRVARARERRPRAASRQRHPRHAGRDGDAVRHRPARRPARGPHAGQRRRRPADVRRVRRSAGRTLEPAPAPGAIVGQQRRRGARAASRRRRGSRSRTGGSPRTGSRGSAAASRAVTVAPRACFVIIASSPKWSPGPIVATVFPATLTVAVPSATTKKPTPLFWPSRTRVVPGPEALLLEGARELAQLPLAEIAEERDAAPGRRPAGARRDPSTSRAPAPNRGVV